MSPTEAGLSDATVPFELPQEQAIAIIPGLPQPNQNTTGVLGRDLNEAYVPEPLVAEPFAALVTPTVFVGTSADEVIPSGPGQDILTGAGGRDVFMFKLDSVFDEITDFGGVGGGGRGESKLLPEYDVLKFEGQGLVAEKMLLTYDGHDTTITFTETPDFQLTLSDFDFTDLDNLPTGDSNIIFNDEGIATDSYDVANDNRTKKIKLFNRNTVTHLNNASNRSHGFNRSNDVINGMAGHDRLKGLSGDDTLRGQQGNDTLFGDSGNDLLEGGDGHDSLKGNNDDDVLYGGRGADRLSGNNGDDTLYGGPGKDRLRGNNGNDVIWSDQGGDNVYGGRGNDEFWVASEVFPDTPSTIYDFCKGHNLLVIDRLPGVDSFDDLSFRPAPKRGTIISALGKDIVIIADKHPGDLKASDFNIIPGDSEPVDLTVVLALANDTGSSSADGITADPAITGAVNQPENVAQLLASLDGGTPVDITNTLQSDGSFVIPLTLIESIQGSDLSDGAYTLQVTAVDATGASSETVSLVFQLDTTAANLSLTLAADSDSVPLGDGATTLATVTLTGQTEPGVSVTLAQTGATTTADATGKYSFSNIDLALGENAFTAIGTDAAGNVATTTQTIIRTPVDTEVPLVEAALVNDSGISDRDGLTSDPTIEGTVNDNLTIVSLRAGFNDTPIADYADISNLLQNDAFTLDQATLASLNGGSLSEGDYILKLIATDSSGNESNLTEVAFILDTTIAAPSLTLATAFDTETVGDGQTSLATVALKGTTEADVLVELQGNNAATVSNGA
ncbi:MAG: Ig-like domain-containing protein, partial [Cyanobacteria bacterium P01_A01_bin.17]